MTPMIINDFQCTVCHKVTEALEEYSTKVIQCPHCRAPATKLFPAPRFKFKEGQDTDSQIAKWAKTRYSHMDWERKHLHQGQIGESDTTS